MRRRIMVGFDLVAGPGQNLADFRIDRHRPDRHFPALSGFCCRFKGKAHIARAKRIWIFYHTGTFVR